MELIAVPVTLKLILNEFIGIGNQTGVNWGDTQKNK